MSRKKIKNPLKKKKPKIPVTSPRHALSAILLGKQYQKKEEDNAEVVILLTQKKLNLSRQFDYKYMAGLAEGLGWKVGRFQKAVARVTQLLKIERETKEKKNEQDRRKNKDS